MSNIYVGTMGWSYDFWKPRFYPKSLASSDFLTYYSKQFNTVEVDSTFYRIPRSQSVLDWKKQTPPGFLFSLKFPRVITHVKMLRDCQEETRVFLERVALLGDKLGPLLLQFPSTFRSEQVVLLRDFLRSLPEEHRYVVEVRNRKMLDDRLYSILRENGVVLAWVDSVSMPVVEEMTGDFVYVRWEGDRRKVSGVLGKVETDRTAEVESWADRLKQLLEKRIEVVGYFSKYFSGFPPSDVHEFMKVLESDDQQARSRGIGSHNVGKLK
jgi:uncharacterized protein YecE (DUF72 family)